MKLILVRHGQTNSNIRLTYSGHLDKELNQTGKLQMQAAAIELEHFLKDESIETIYTSYLKRAIESAEILADHFHFPQKRIIVAPQIAEMHFGIFEGMTNAEIAEEYPKEFRQWKENYIDYQIPSGESNRMVYDRTAGFFGEFIQSHEHGVYVFVMHMCAICHSVSAMLNMGLDQIWRFQPRNAGITVIKVNDRKECVLTGMSL